MKGARQRPREEEARMWRVPLFELNYDERETEAVCQVLESGWITMGQRTKDFEDAFEEQLGGGGRCGPGVGIR